MLKLKNVTKLYRAGEVETLALSDVSLEVADNVEVALLYRRVPAAERKRRVREALERVGIGHRAGHRPQQLSGGQQQRVAVARALVSAPKLILADEPTGNLDTANGEAVMALLQGAATAGVTIVMVTHSLTHAAAAQRSINLLDGRVVAETLLAA
ncbi:MAG TPA: ATP-binding cassette domain-containing protein [Caulobacteraceae bacterium]|nr:ATP-binding cassette domain-containing protein [Caulobacteraceae bacterium]